MTRKNTGRERIFRSLKNIPRGVEYEKNVSRLPELSHTAAGGILADAAGLKIIGIETISENGTYSYERGPMNFVAKESAAADTAGTVVQAAKLNVEATVSITFKTEE